MNSFYKGGSELPTVKVSSCSHRIKSKKLGLLALKLVALCRLYFTSIDKALVKHSLSTDIVLFTQQLRKRLEKGKTCYQSACQLLYTYLISGSSITVEKLVQKPIKSKTFSSAFFLTNFAPTSAVHAFGHQSSVAVPLVFPEGDPKTTRRNTEQRWENGRSWSGIGWVMVDYRSAQETHKVDYSLTQETHKVDYSLTQETHKVDYRMSLASPLLSTCYAQGRHKKCTRAFQSKENSIVTHGVELKGFVLSGFKSICGVQSCQADALLSSVGLIVQRALKCFSFVASHERLYRMMLTCIVLMMVSMFSLSAQTPRRDSGADGLSNLMALKPGDKIPDTVWEMPFELNYFNGKKKTIKFSELKGKVILLDFWSTGCASCIEGIPKMEMIQQRFQDEIYILMVNSKRNKDTAQRINKRFEKYKQDFNYTPSLPTILEDTFFTTLFEHNSLPTIAIINSDGKFVLNSFAGSITEEGIRELLKTGSSNMFIEKSAIKNLNRSDTPPLIDTTGLLFCSVMSGYRKNYLGVYPAVQYKNGNTLFQVGNYFLNTCYQLAFPDVFRETEFNLFVFDQQIEKEFIDLLYDFKTRRGQFWYQLYVRDSIPESHAFNYFRQALLERFNVAAERRNDSVDAYMLTLEDTKLLATKGGMRTYSVDKGNQSLILRNIPVNGLVNFIRSVLDKPVVYKIDRAEKIDLELPGSFLDLPVVQKIAILKTYGIHLKAATYNGVYPYFYPVSTQHTR
ncbi:TlpA family protein disulfide reductase [Sphingobacterium sp. NGMCC 1.201703]|uniref:TlpA family protein disulfide reductase n=1 Tax=Sphingobacterium sp. NGMCC 1.201703 TaxID=3388657 RepID=UPI0039FBF6F0